MKTISDTKYFLKSIGSKVLWKGLGSSNFDLGKDASKRKKKKKDEGSWIIEVRVIPPVLFGSNHKIR